MDDPYLNDLRGEFNSYSNQLKKLKKKLLKTNSIVEQEKIIKQIDSTAKKMENNQRQSVKVTKSRLKERKKKSKRQNYSESKSFDNSLICNILHPNSLHSIFISLVILTNYKNNQKVIKLAKKVQNQSDQYKLQLKKCEKKLNKNKYIIF